jgi:hypothetical protein
MMKLFISAVLYGSNSLELLLISNENLGTEFQNIVSLL